MKTLTKYVTATTATLAIIGGPILATPTVTAAPAPPTADTIAAEGWQDTAPPAEATAEDPGNPFALESAEANSVGEGYWWRWGRTCGWQLVGGIGNNKLWAEQRELIMWPEVNAGCKLTGHQQRGHAIPIRPAYHR